MKSPFLISSLLLGTAFGGMAQQWPSRQIAKGESVTLTAHAENALSYLWFRDGNVINDTHDQKLVVNEAGLYTVIALNGDCSSEMSDPVQIVIDSEGEKIQVDMHIRMEVDPQAVFVESDFDYQIYIINQGEHPATDIRVRDVLPPALEYQRALSGHIGAVTYQPETREVLWLPGTMDPGQMEQLRIRVKAMEGGWVENRADVESKETDSDISTNTASVTKEIHIFKIPNVFTPNDDGLNDTFEIKGLLAFPENELMIFNRVGNRLYERMGYQNDWTGDNHADGTYYYVLRVKIDNSWKIFKGHVAIIRNPR